MRKEDEPTETRVLESSAVDNEDRNFVVEDKGMVEKKSKDSKIIVKDEESSDIGNDDKTSDLGDKACKDKSERVEEGEWIEYDQPLDLVDIDDDFRRGCESPLDLKNEFYKDIDKLGPSYNWKTKRLDLEGPLESKSSRISEGSVETASGFAATPSEVKGDDVTTTCDAVTITDIKKPLEDSAG
ncbi:hypothetical protein Tco_0213121 [Tanacetum coccineum]